MSSRRRPIFTGVRYPSRRGRYTPLKLPQTPERPLKLNQRDLVRGPALREELPWQVIRRRGPRREMVGQDPLEARAIPHWKRRGTLPERILLKYLLEVLRLTEGIDFDFQSSLLGGRLEMGGIVADFIFPILKVVLNPAGPTHEGFFRRAKDEEQRQTLAELGYTVYLFDDDIVYNEYRLEELMRTIFNLRPATGGSAFGGNVTEINAVGEWDALWMMDKARTIQEDLRLLTINLLGQL